LIPFTFLPREGFAAIRVMFAVEANLISIINARRTGIGKHKEPRQPQRVFISTGAGEEARRIVTIQQIHLSICDILFVKPKVVINPVCELMRINDMLDAVIIGLLVQDSKVDMSAREK